MTPMEICLTLLLVTSYVLLECYRRLLVAAHKRYDELSAALDRIREVEAAHD